MSLFLPSPSAVSGEVPEEPVLSPPSKHVFEKRLAVKFIEENGTDPVTGEAMAVEDLIEIKGEAEQMASQQSCTHTPFCCICSAVSALLSLLCCP